MSAALARAQEAAPTPTPPAEGATDWLQCQRLTGDDAARLACYDRWAQRQTQPPSGTPDAPNSPAAPALAATPSDGQPPAPTAPVTTPVAVAANDNGCRDPQYSLLSRFWELEPGSSCGAFSLRGYRPLDIAFSMATRRPATPASPAPDHTAEPRDYQRGEMRINLSLRTKIAQNLLTRGQPGRQDSLWFAYSQQSTWQVFNAAISRPFRSTDHEPEIMYVYPLDRTLPGGWRWRYAGLGVVHQSNGQSLPLSRSWNRVYLMGGMELDNRWRVTGRIWQRIHENAADDDNPDIVRYIGRAELASWWTPDKKNSYGLTARVFGRGSARLEWLRALGDPATSNLRLHAQLFYGYGDTLIDYNRLRTVLSIGLSLVDF